MDKVHTMDKEQIMYKEHIPINKYQQKTIVTKNIHVIITMHFTLVYLKFYYQN